MPAASPPAPQCPIEYALHRIGGKHKGRLLFYLRHGPQRYGQLRRLLFDGSRKMLTQALRELEADGLLARHVFEEAVPRVEYSLLPTGTQLLPFIILLNTWGKQRLAAQGLPIMPSPEKRLTAG